MLPTYALPVFTPHEPYVSLLQLTRLGFQLQISRYSDGCVHVRGENRWLSICLFSRISEYCIGKSGRKCPNKKNKNNNPKHLIHKKKFYDH